MRPIKLPTPKDIRHKAIMTALAALRVLFAQTVGWPG